MKFEMLVWLWQPPELAGPLSARLRLFGVEIRIV